MLEEKVFHTILENNLIKQGDHIILGVSGGPDSSCLFHILLQLQKKLNYKISVCHINHGIRKEAILDQKYVEDLCRKHEIPCYTKTINIEEKARKEKIGTEEAGRKVRYEFFEEIRKKVGASKIVTAHTKNDQVETVLMNLIRGTGLTGLTGIKVERENVYIRPLITCTKKEIEEYCKKHKLNPRIDQTNFENIYTRNKIRNQLIPFLEKEFNPNILESISRMSEILSKENQYLEKITKQEYEELFIEQDEEKITLDLKKFNLLDLVIKNRIVLYTITVLFGSSSGIEKIHIQDIIKLCKNNRGNKFLIPNKKIKILVKNKKIFFIKNE